VTPHPALARVQEANQVADHYKIMKGYLDNNKLYGGAEDPSIALQLLALQHLEQLLNVESILLCSSPLVLSVIISHAL